LGGKEDVMAKRKKDEEAQLVSRAGTYADGPDDRGLTRGPAPEIFFSRRERD
jgi:hypothetical protein